jgi:predicted hydrolase (HD superfamily)
METTAFARAVDRSQTEQCEEKLGIKLDKFIGIVLGAMKSRAEELGL